MLTEVRDVLQPAGGVSKRWFADDFFDLFVFFRAGKITGFQLAYDKHTPRERSLVWEEGAGFKHCGVDDGERAGRVKSSPLLVADGAFDALGIGERFRRESRQIEAAVAEFVLARLAEAGEVLD